MLDLTRIQKQDRSPTCSTINRLRNSCLFYKINDFKIVNSTGSFNKSCQHFKVIKLKTRLVKICSIKFFTITLRNF